MNQKKAKAIRKEVYGDMSSRNTKYITKDESDKGEDKEFIKNPTIHADKLRKEYQNKKKEYKSSN